MKFSQTRKWMRFWFVVADRQLVLPSLYLATLAERGVSIRLRYDSCIAHNDKWNYQYLHCSSRKQCLGVCRLRGRILSRCNGWYCVTCCINLIFHCFELMQPLNPYEPPSPIVLMDAKNALHTPGVYTSIGLKFKMKSIH